MKLAVGLLSLAFSVSALATTAETVNFIYDGSATSAELLLSTEKTHTEYRYDTVETTCSRQEIVGRREICSGGGPVIVHRPFPGPGPIRRHPGPGPVHRRPIPGPRHCTVENTYRTVYFPCTQTVKTPFEVKDFDVNARVIVDVTKLSQEATPGETFKVSLVGDSLSFEAIGSKKFFIVKKKQDIQSSMSGSVKMINALFAVELVEAAPVLNAISLSDISIDNSVLSFGLGPVESLANIGFDLTIVNVKFFGADITLLDRELLASEIEVKPVTNGSVASVQVDKLGVVLSGGKYSLTAKAFAKFDGDLMNGSQYEELSASKTLIYKMR